MSKNQNDWSNRHDLFKNFPLKYWGSAHRYCNVNFNINHKTRIVFHSLKNYDSHLIKLELIKWSK